MKRLGWMALAVLAACQLQVAPKKPAVKASASATPRASAAPSAGPTAFHTLVKPAGGTATLTGKVKIDAAFVVGLGAGSIISDHGGGIVANNGGSVLAAGGGILSDHGAGILSNNAGNVVAAPGGNVISDQGGSLISDQGGGILANNSAGILANNGAGLVSNNGGGLTSKTKRRLLADEQPAYGQQLPAVGMRLFAVSARTGQLLSLGKDDQGRDVYAIYTALDGGYTVYVPDTIKDYVRVVAVVPDRKEARLGYNVFGKPNGAEASIDEDAAVATQYLRRAFRAKFENLLQLNDLANGGDVPSDQILDKFFGQARAPAPIKDVMAGLVKDLFAAVKANPRIQRADYGPLAQALGDALLARAEDLEALELDPSYFGKGATAQSLAGQPYTSGKALANMRAILAEFREHVIAAGHGDAAATQQLFAGKPYLSSANAFHARLFPQDPRPFYAVEKPADLADFLTREYFALVAGTPYGCALPDCPATPDASCDITNGCIPPAGVKELSNAQIFTLPKLVLADLGMPESYVGVLNAVGASVSYAVGLKLADDEVKADMLALIRGYGATASP
jgi:hypothetical protein